MDEEKIKELGMKIMSSLKAELQDKWEEAEVFAESESKKFAGNIAEIALWERTGKITKEQSVVLLRMHQRSMKMVLTALEGISLVLAERAINSVIETVGDFVNDLIGWKLFK